jgi:hypothetical protein
MTPDQLREHNACIATLERRIHDRVPGARHVNGDRIMAAVERASIPIASALDRLAADLGIDEDSADRLWIAVMSGALADVNNTAVFEA